ncbi:MAG: pilus assembly protein HicB [Bacteroidales bacterium]|nr:pilus assembly protein HicB [Bacteroidales bacterium]
MSKRKIKAIIEKGKDGKYSVYSQDHFGNSYFGGFGESVAGAKEDFLESVKEAIREEQAENHPVCSYEDVSVEYSYDIPSFFNLFDFINVSRFAEYAGVNESKMRAYKSGVSFPGEKTTAKILRAVKHIGEELTAVTLL